MLKKKIPFALAVAAVISAAMVGSDHLATPQIDAQDRSHLVNTGRAQTFLKLPMGTMHVRVSGPDDGPVVLLVHGAFISGASFEPWLRPLADAGYRVIAPDLLGYGYSDRPDGRYDGDFYTAQLDQLLKAMKIDRPVHLAGVSMGAAVLASFTQRRPHLVRSVALIAPDGVGGTSLVFEPLLLPVVGDLAFGVLGPRNVRALMREAYQLPSHDDRWDVLVSEQASYWGYTEGILKTLRHLNAHWMPEAYQAIGRTGVPAMALWGTHDAVNRFEESRMLSEWMPQVHVVPVDGENHALAVGDPSVILQSMIPFLDSAEEAGER